ncbi:MAG: 50S ribosomal protein L10 [Alphaproteobacteria bacterium]|nr:50S ribosomal protein L10 [Alphaproteobacteria bacterium]MBF0250352.1 50S ribosomal protein L10 [Alphaproteobacteria bacterium]
MDRSQKEQLVAELHETLQGAQTVIVTHNLGLTVRKMEDLRVKLMEAGAKFKVTKNRLTRLALKDTQFEGIADLFTGPTGIAYSEDVVAAAKVAAKFAKDNDKFEIVGGAMGTTVLDVAGVQALATMPSLDELRGKLVGLIQAPATKVAGVLQAPAGQLARVCGAYAAKGEAA